MTRQRDGVTLYLPDHEAVRVLVLSAELTPRLAYLSDMAAIPAAIIARMKRAGNGPDSNRPNFDRKLIDDEAAGLAYTSRAEAIRALLRSAAAGYDAANEAVDQAFKRVEAADRLASHEGVSLSG